MKKGRLNLSLNTKTRKKIESLRQDTGAQTITDVVIRAVWLYDYFWQQEKDGKTIKIDDIKVKIL